MQCDSAEGVFIDRWCASSGVIRQSAGTPKSVDFSGGRLAKHERRLAAHAVAIYTSRPMTSSRNRLFLMMVLEIAIWGAWQIKIFNYMGMLHFNPGQQALVASVFGIASLVGIFFSNQFADRNFAAERFVAFSHLVGGLALIATSFMTSFWPFFGFFLLY